MSSHVRYRYCLVPMCTNTTTKTPSKAFLSIPQKEDVRRKWYNAMKRDIKYQTKSHLHCCEDHFNLAEDVENYVRFKLMGGCMRLKKSVVPHKFDCQKNQLATPKQKELKSRRLEVNASTAQCNQLESQPSTSVEEQAGPQRVTTQTCSLALRNPPKHFSKGT